MTDADKPALIAKQTPRFGRAAIALFIAAVAGVGVLYGMFAGGGKDRSPGECAASRASAERLKPLARGQVAGLGVSTTPRVMPRLDFEGPAGIRTSLADLRGKTLLLNLWATWCIPCREEMPALDQLQAKLGGVDFEVIAISIDTTRLDKRAAFLSEAGVKSLTFYADPTAEVFQVLKKAGKVVGLPTTILVDASGCELGVMPGPADWASEDALRLIAQAKAI